MQKKFGIVVVAAIQGSGQKQHGRPGVSKVLRRRTVGTPMPVASAA